MTIMGTKTITIDDPFAGGTMRNVWTPVIQQTQDT
jgi:hypothetical protein